MRVFIIWINLKIQIHQISPEILFSFHVSIHENISLKIILIFDFHLYSFRSFSRQHTLLGYPYIFLSHMSMLMWIFAFNNYYRHGETREKGRNKTLLFFLLLTMWSTTKEKKKIELLYNTVFSLNTYLIQIFRKRRHRTEVSHHFIPKSYSKLIKLFAWLTFNRQTDAYMSIDTI